MRIAEYIDTCDLKESLRSWFINNQPEVLELLASEEARLNRQKEKREEGGMAGLSSQSGLRRRKKKNVGGESLKSSLDTSDPLEQVREAVLTTFPCPSMQPFNASY